MLTAYLWRFASYRQLGENDRRLKIRVWSPMINDDDDTLNPLLCFNHASHFSASERIMPSAIGSTANERMLGICLNKSIRKSLLIVSVIVVTGERKFLHSGAIDHQRERFRWRPIIAYLDILERKKSSSSRNYRDSRRRSATHVGLRYQSFVSSSSCDDRSVEDKVRVSIIPPMQLEVPSISGRLRERNLVE